MVSQDISWSTTDPWCLRTFHGVIHELRTQKGFLRRLAHHEFHWHTVKVVKIPIPVSTVPARNAWEPDLPDLLCPKYEEKRLADYDPGCYATSSDDATIKIDASKISVDASHRFQPSTEVEEKVGQPHQPNTVFLPKRT